ncbi:hypothetical protein [Aurantiacibacter zhengii]|uniref:Uncharacterized protein n=1 Tax=Aurantiacibacter zhengii TaxID=2307003 RepID=A0A418NP23_9SPHN|nr:hypothetical protein [Aurantiacibacter zhengii]RIV83910.1 hypothetical protein D2V07_15645 [Aurantiacibacter zhengii]
MNQQTGNDRYSGTTPPVQNQKIQQTPAPAVMTEAKQAGAQMENQARPKDTEERRQQAAQQSDQGLGTGAQDAEDRGYGDASKKREEKLDDDAD